MNEILNQQKQQALLTFYQVSWNEMSWRRNAGYRTIILGFAYFGLMIGMISYNHSLSSEKRFGLAAVIAIGTLFGSGYLLSNYRKYMAAAEQTVRIEQYLGAYDPDYLGSIGALMPMDRSQRPKVPITRDMVCLWSVIAFLAGGLLTAAAILLV